MLAPRALRSLLGPGLAAALVAGTPAAAAASWRPHVHEAVVYAEHRKGEVRFAVRTEHRLWGYRRSEGLHALSVVKALLLVAYLDDPRVRSRRLRAADHRHRVAVAVLTGANPDHAYGEQTLRGVFARLLRGLDARLVLTPT